MVCIHILNGPNLNLLGTREPQIYGSDTLSAIETACHAHANGLGATLIFEQTNSEGTLIDQIQCAGREADALILNAAGYTHTSVAIHDALKAIPTFKIELHLSNPHARESFRHKSFVSPAVNGVICGFGAAGYRLAIDAAMAAVDDAASD
ncbi:type II 3-dehydroquinate dehydratase [Parvularcula sp. LCG005]|uniref:type II 3-dehydroquinate dehydratase n=1 Tax=Parvularcula sp. LCG005 TaxID=3078805 RepID=UPI0029423610|nr:type II 3-dehydroquinate dehydratase [Parvularcula sp. LCG005]WOI52420.1 type II 3-dehydroquinate dehydratase [Parvularcula sp. LCG005]